MGLALNTTVLMRSTKRSSGTLPPWDEHEAIQTFLGWFKFGMFNET